MERTGRPDQTRQASRGVKKSPARPALGSPRSGNLYGAHSLSARVAQTMSAAGIALSDRRGMAPLLRSHKETEFLSQISFARVAPHHALAIEVISDVADRLLHHTAPPGRVIVVERKDRALQLVVKGSSVRLIRGSIVVLADRPACHPLDARFDPPAVEDAKIEHAVERCFHPASARSLQWRQGRVEPYVRAGDQRYSDPHIVIRQEDASHLAAKLAAKIMEPADRFLAGVVARMRLAGHYHLQWVLLRNSRQPAGILEEKQRALVAGHPASEADDRRVGIHDGTSRQFHQFDEVLLGGLMAFPNRVVG